MPTELESLIQLAVEQRIADWQAQFATVMQSSMQAGLAELDNVRDQLETERRELADALERTRNERESIIRSANQLLQEALEANYKAWKQKIELEVLTRLARRHLEAGETSANISGWLNVEEPFVTTIERQLQIEELSRKSRRAAERISLPHNPRLTYETVGRGGTIHFQNDFTAFGLWWEFGGRDALALIELPAPQHWEARTKIPLSDREVTIRFIAEQVLEDQTRDGGAYRYSDDILTIYL